MADLPDAVGGESAATPATPSGSRMRSLAIDLSPLRSSRDFRILWFGQLVALIGRQITVVALPYQVFRLTGSSLAVGLIGLVQVVPLIAFSLAGGAVADRVDRRRLILLTEVGFGLATAMLLGSTLMADAPLWYVYAATALSAGMGAVNAPARTATVPNLVRRDQLSAAVALNQVLFQTSMIVGPALAGLLLAELGLAWTYAVDLLAAAVAFAFATRLRPIPPAATDPATATGWRAVREGFAFLRRSRPIVGSFLIDLNAMIFGMPRALFPVLAARVFHVGEQGLGLLFAAPAVGALLGAMTSGWVGRVRRQGAAVTWAVIAWGAAIACFGLSGRWFGLALLLLAAAGAADVISAVFRGTILYEAAPDQLRGRLSAVHIMVVTGGPRLGDVEAGLVAALATPVVSVVSGGLACIVGAVAIAAALPEFAGYRAGRRPADEPAP